MDSGIDDWLQTAMAYAVVSECPDNCDYCEYDDGVKICKEKGCKDKYFYASENQCVG